MKYRELLNIVNKDLQLPAILAINSSINAEESLSRVFEVLQGFLDADGAFVNIFDTQKHRIVFVAHCRRDGVSSTLGSLVPPKSLRPLKITDKVLNCPDISQDRFTQQVLSECLPEVKSYLMLSMDKEERHLGVVCFYSRRYDQFNEAQRILLKSLHDSFSLMTSNALNSVLLANNLDLIQENDGLKDSVRGSRMALVNRFSARTPSLKEITEKIEKVSSTEVPILVLGETGCGKEVVVNLIQELSNRGTGPFVKLNCGAIPETLIDDEFFGHEKGAFTDARESRPGKFEAASGSTLFLDEIGNLPVGLQAKLLAALQNREVTRLGSNRKIPIDIRLIAATNRDLPELVKQSLFREDLYYRINTIQIEIPPLRNRREDIPLFIDYFLKKYTALYNQPGLTIHPQAAAKLERYDWPGNIRELQHTIEKAVILAEKNVIRAADLFIRPGKSVSFSDAPNLGEVERKTIEAAITQNDGNLTAAAEQLGVSRQTLYNKLKRFNL